MKARPYQAETTSVLFNFVEEGFDGEHPIAALPTGSGKTFVLCDLIDKILSEYPEESILVLSHVKEILSQDHSALVDYFEGVNIGLYSSGMDSKTIERITVAGIQSAYRSPNLFQRFGFVIIDECHLVSFKSTTMYRTFLDSLDGAMYIGLTATPFRLDGGYLHEGENALFTDIIIDYTQMDKFNELIDEGYLSQLFIKKTLMRMTMEGVRTTAGDFNQADLSTKFDRDSITKEAIDEIVKFGKNYKKWIIFAIDIDHAEHITKELNDRHIPTLCVHSEMEYDRDISIRDFKNGMYRCVVNVNILTTGFDVPDIDLIGMLRPTKSPVVHAQTIGRGLRVVYKEGMPLATKEERLAAIAASRKKHCLVLDFAGNTKRLGPVNDIRPKKKRKKGEGKGEPITKDCPNCDLVCHPAVRFCPACNWKFEFKEKLTPEAEAELEIIRRKVKEQKESLEEASRASIERNVIKKVWVKVLSVTYGVHDKVGSPSSLKVTYDTGLQQFTEWVTIDHGGYAKLRATNWIKHRTKSGDPTPDNLADLLQAVEMNLILIPDEIEVDNNGKYISITDTKGFHEDHQQRPPVYNYIPDDDDIPF